MFIFLICLSTLYPYVPVVFNAYCQYLAILVFVGMKTQGVIQSQMPATGVHHTVPSVHCTVKSKTVHHILQALCNMQSGGKITRRKLVEYFGPLPSADTVDSTRSRQL